MAWILGISVSHNGAACLMRDGEIAVAVQEERLTRHKRDPIDLDRSSVAISYCLDTVGISPNELDMVVVCSQGEVIPETMHSLLDDQLALSRHGIPVEIIGHHLGHLLSALALSGYDSCAGLVVDGMGSPFRSLTKDERTVCCGDLARDWECISLYDVANGLVRPIEKMGSLDGRWIGDVRDRMRSYGSLGGMYACVAEQVFGDITKAGHVMGLAALGVPAIPVRDFFEIRDGQFVYHDKVSERFGNQERWPYHDRLYENLAASVQAALESAILYLAERLWHRTRRKRLCYSGGVALNALVNEALYRKTRFTNIFIPAAAEDSGPAIGAAYWGYRQLSGRRTRLAVSTDGFGRHYSHAEIESAIHSVPGLSPQWAREDLLRRCATRLSRGEVCGWFQKGAELGPRALGNRSILADPRYADIKDRLNRKVKFREQFRPFAPAVLGEDASEWFETARPDDRSDFMLRTWRVRPEKRGLVPGIVHADGTSRAQTVCSSAAPEFHGLISAFKALTGVPMLINTSFNINGEPIVETPEDALWCFLLTDIDFCVLDDIIVDKAESRMGLLKLCPRLTPEVSKAIETGDVFTPLEFHSRTRWGTFLRTIPGGARLLLQYVDGERTLAAIAVACAEDGLLSPDDLCLIDTFVALRRVGAVEFSSANLIYEKLAIDRQRSELGLDPTNHSS